MGCWEKARRTGEMISMQLSEQPRDFIISKLKSNTTITEDNHFLWNGELKNGYGRIGWNGRGNNIDIHRLSAHLFLNLDLNSELFALHKVDCHIRNCWNPDHLYVGDSKDNRFDSVLNNTHNNKSKTHCKQGHEFTEENTYIDPLFRRNCKICRRAKDKNRPGDRHKKEI